MTGNTLTSMDLVRLAQQLDRDRELGWQELQSRDYAIGVSCRHKSDKQRLSYWLDSVADPADEAEIHLPMSERSLGVLVTSIFLVIGFATMAGFLFSHTQGLVNVLWFFAFFVALQFALCLVSGITLVAVLSGNSSASFTFNPARLVYSRSMPAKRYWREFKSVFQLVFMRYGQDMGIGFILGALGAFLLILAVNDFSFTWSSTFNLSNEAVLRFSEIVSAPWRQWLPLAAVDAETVANSRYHPTGGKFSTEQLSSMHSWWPFLFASMAFYVLLPRLLLWFMSRWLYASKLARSFVSYPGAELVLQRMAAPSVHTQAPRKEYRPGDDTPRALPAGGIPARDDLLVISWGGAVAVEELPDYPELAGIEPARLCLAGLSLEQDEATLRLAEDKAIGMAMLVVKSWEPPMSDLADFIALLRPLASVVIFLKPLKGGAIDDNALADWLDFARQLEGGEVSVKALSAGHGGTASGGS
jgi:hypothetical protein